ncbi:ribonuclease VapC22 [Microcystis aeruginosa NIES-4285]|uniref:Ribonuclease VapC22 n=1 Tax=Microcystis aeruginosa NIES-4285 TaxID=2497681 RepID=A0A402DL54_MICAE|nr:ribonuclease VapC22 [Microcystis aeruginosa NIES-4285]
MIILDTHIWFWYINENFEQFPLEWTAQIRQADSVGVSPISCYEIALAHHKGRLALDIPIQQWLIDALNPSGIELLPLTPEITLRAVNLSPVHKDPFDRIIIGTALLLVQPWNIKQNSPVLIAYFPNIPNSKII